MPHELTQALAGAKAGEPEAIERLYRAAYSELRIIARAHLRSKQRRTLDTTALVNEAYLRLFEGASPQLADRKHFFALSARAMRHVLVDHFRSRAAKKRGSGETPFPLREDLLGEPEVGDRILAVHEALERLAAEEPRMARVVEYKFFGGMTEKEIAEVLGLTTRTVSTDWRLARAWLTRDLGETPESPE